MFKNYFSTTLRSLRKNPVFALINILGLSVGIAAFVLITVFIRDEVTFDRFHKNHDRIYRSMLYSKNGFTTNFPGELVELASQTMPEIEEVTQLAVLGNAVMEYEGEKVFEKEFYSADPALFRIFDFSLKFGNEAEALSTQNGVVISQYMALKYFGQEDAVGKSFRFANREGDWIVTGVLNDIPDNSRFRFNIIIPNKVADTSSWRWAGTGDLYMRLSAPVDSKLFSDRLMALAVENGFNQSAFEFKVENFGQLYFNSQLSATASGVTGNKDFVYIFSIVGFFLLLLACINYVNSSTAKSLTRLKEVGIRKVIGANRRQIKIQFILETAILVLVSVVGAAGIAEYFLPTLNELSGKTLQLNYFSDRFILIFLLLLIPAITLLAGVYPALFAARFKILLLMKGQTPGGKGALRKYLVAFQLVITLILLFGTQTIKKQIDFFMAGEIGMDPSGVISAYIPRGKSYDIVKQAIESVPGVQEVTSSPFPSVGSSKIPITWTSENEEKNVNVHYDRVAPNAIRLLDLKITQGRNFIEGSEEDKNSAVIISQSVARAMELDNPVGTSVKVYNEDGNSSNSTIVGVVQDLQFNLKREPLPIIILPGNKYLGMVNIKLNEFDRAETVLRVSKAWEELDPNRPFQYSVLEDQIQANYEKEKKFGKVIQFFSWVAMLIAGLGLFSLSTFTILQKYKEVGIKKVLGASVLTLLAGFLKTYFSLIAIAACVAIPVAYWLMDSWLSEFANHIQLGVGVFITGIAISLLIVLLTIGYQSVKAALANPVDILRNE